MLKLVNNSKIYENTYSVYKHVLPNGKVYIGMTVQTDVNRRWQNGYGYKSQRLFYRAIKKYGWENVSHEVISTGLSKSEAEAEEIRLIAQYHAADPKFGYNVENGGNCPGTHSDETKRKISEAQMGEKNHMFGRSPLKGKKATPEAIEKNRLGHLGQIPYNKGKKMSDAQREKLRGIKKSPEHIELMRERSSKPVICIETGKQYRSGKEAATEHGLHRCSVTRVCGKADHTAGGFHWKYANEG